METLLGIDFGTGGCKVSAIDFAGNLVGEASSEYTTYHDHPGWSEQEPADWYAALRTSLAALAAKGVSLSSCRACALDGSTHNAVLLDEAYRPLRRTIEDKLESLISEEIIKGTLTPGSIASASLANRKLKLKVVNE